MSDRPERKTVIFSTFPTRILGLKYEDDGAVADFDMEYAINYSEQIVNSKFDTSQMMRNKNPAD